MRMIYLALVVFVVVLALGIVSAAHSFDPAPQQVAANYTLALELPGLDRPAPKFMTVREDTPLQFCGQCTGDSDCGSAHKCCGPSSCRECFRVDTCP